MEPYQEWIDGPNQAHVCELADGTLLDLWYDVWPRYNTIDYYFTAVKEGIRFTQHAELRGVLNTTQTRFLFVRESLQQYEMWVKENFRKPLNISYVTPR